MPLLSYEGRNEPLISRSAFARRMTLHFLIVVAGLGVSLLVGIIGYAALAGLPPVDAFLNAAMILGGMGPVDQLTSDAAKVFAGLYAIYSGVFFIAMAGIIAAPIAHRVLHDFHIDPKASDTDD